MTVAAVGAVITALKAASALTTLLGGQYVYPRSMGAPTRIPGLYLSLSGETSKRRPGYLADRKRDNAPVLQVSVFHAGTAAQVDAIADAVDVALLSSNLAGTRGWRRVSRVEQFEEDTRLHHVSLRYAFEYTITDT
jgi:hypothetical protein